MSRRPAEPSYNTAAGVFGQLCVSGGERSPITVLPMEQATEPEKKVVIHAGQFATSPPQYWQPRRNSSDDARFNIHFWVAEETDGENRLLFTRRKRDPALNAPCQAD